MKRYAVLIIVLTLVALWPFFRKGFYTSHDGEWMIIRFTAFHQTLRTGQLPVRFVDRLNNNYGYPVLNFLYPLPFYVSEIPKVLGFGFVNSIKITFILATVSSTVLMYWALSQAFNPFGSLAGAIVYLYIPYRFVDLYVRGSLGESLAFAIIPITLGFIYKLKKKSTDIFLPLLAIAVSLLILSHNVMAILFTPVLFIIGLMYTQSKLKLALAFFAGIAMSSFFWIPAIYDLQYVRFSQIKISEVAGHLVSVKDLFIPRWGYGPSPDSPVGMSAQIGIITIIVVAAAIYFLVKNKKKSKNVIFLVGITLLAIFLMTKTSSPFWQHVPSVDVIQFPWRLLSLVVFCASLLTAQVVAFTKNNKVVAFLIVLTSFLTTIAYTKPAAFVDRGDGYYATNEDTTTVRNEYMPIWVKQTPTVRASEKIEVAGANISQTIIKSAKYRAEIDAQKDTQVRVNAVYFPGWEVLENGKHLSIDYSNHAGIITFTLPAGIHEVIIRYGKTPVHLFSEIVSILALIGTGIYFYILWRKQNS